jgi:hypothetical protein
MAPLRLDTKRTTWGRVPLSQHADRSRQLNRLEDQLLNQLYGQRMSPRQRQHLIRLLTLRRNRLLSQPLSLPLSRRRNLSQRRKQLQSERLKQRRDRQMTDFLAGLV